MFSLDMCFLIISALLAKTQDIITRHQGPPPYTLVGFSHYGARLALDIAHHLAPSRVLVVCIDGTPHPAACPLQLHDPLYYALFYLVRETHPATIQLPFGRFMDVLCSDPAVDVHDAAVEHLRPADVGPQVWSTAVGLALHRAGRMRTLLQEEEEVTVEGLRHVRIVAAAGIEATGVQEDAATVVSVVPDDQFGAAFGAAPASGRVIVLPGTVHSEMLLDARTWQRVAEVVSAAVQGFLCVEGDV